MQTLIVTAIGSFSASAVIRSCRACGFRVVGTEIHDPEDIAESADEIFVAAKEGDAYVGFLCLKETGRETVELAVMGVLREYHRSGIGRRLFEAARAIAQAEGYLFMQVKTVRMGVYEDYDITNRFYRACGFKEFEMIPGLWGEENPCQIYVMYLPS